MTDRDEFELWASGAKMKLARMADGEGYVNNGTHWAWIGWKSRAELQIKKENQYAIATD